MIDTHYIHRPHVFDAEVFSGFVADVRKIVASLPPSARVCGFDGTGEPEVTGQRVAFNGEKARHADHEPLVIERVFDATRSLSRNGVYFAFCKTMGKPYDLAVVATLFAFISRFPEATFVSDSGAAELREGYEFYKRVCNPQVSETLFERPIRERMQ